LEKVLRSRDLELDVLPGAEVRIDERVCQLLESDEILTLADGVKYILLEFPHDVFLNIEPLLSDLASIGIEPIISHLEINLPFEKYSKVLSKWIEYPVHMQIDAASLLGDYGPRIENTAWHILGLGWADFVATDAHNTTSRRPRMKAVFKQISKKLGKDIAELVCIENPARVVTGRDIVSVRSAGHKEVSKT
jgi:protein-tyrosine phosphatase